MKLEKQTKRKRVSTSGKRFYTALDMAVVKHDTAVRNSKVNRGEIPRHGNERINMCSCGQEGCFIHVGNPTRD